MDSRVRRINQLVKRYDGKLLAKRDHKGVVHIYRKSPIADTFQHEGISYVHVFHVDDYVVSLTDNWKHDGIAVDRGLDPIWAQLCRMDSWRDDGGYERFSKSRNRFKADQHRMLKNELRSRAADMRTDFAKATNDLVIRH